MTPARQKSPRSTPIRDTPGAFLHSQERRWIPTDQNTTDQTTTNRFTDEQMTTARETDLPDLLTHLGYSVRSIGRYHTTKEMDSLRIKDRRTWVRYSEHVGGDAITFLQHFEGKSFPEAVNYLLAYHGHARDSPGVQRPRPPPTEPEKPPFALPPAHTDQRRVFAYLSKRGIAPQVVHGFIQAGLLYEDAQHHNCVFVGRDQTGKPVFANKRGTYDLDGGGFKGDVPSSDKDVAFRLPCDPALDWVAVFEAPIDLMSFCTLHRAVMSNAVALCGLYEGPLDTYLRENPHLKRIVLCLDADSWGRKAAERFQEVYSQKGYMVSTRTPAQGKDWNELLQQRTAARERGR